MNCADLEGLLCDYVDGTLAPAEKATVEHHLSGCPSCAELVRDASAAVEFMERAADVEPPLELATKILFDAPWTRHKSPLSGLRGRFAAVAHAVLQPRLAMGMAMTILSFSMLARYVGPVRQLTPSDLQPTKIWASVEDRSYRVWARTVKFYENLKFVYQVQSTLREWQQQQEEDQRLGGDAEERRTEEHKLPLKSPPAQPSGPAGTKR